jgi:hypothetical protein
MSETLAFCPYCGTHLATAGLQFCVACGRRLAEAEPSSDTLAIDPAGPAEASPATQAPTTDSDTAPSEPAAPEALGAPTDTLEESTETPPEVQLTATDSVTDPGEPAAAEAPPAPADTPEFEHAAAADTTAARPADPHDRAMKRCPMCAEDVRAEALICRFCRYEFPSAEASGPPEQRVSSARFSMPGPAEAVAIATPKPAVPPPISPPVRRQDFHTERPSVRPPYRPSTQTEYAEPRLSDGVRLAALAAGGGQALGLVLPWATTSGLLAMSVSPLNLMGMASGDSSMVAFIWVFIAAAAGAVIGAAGVAMASNPDSRLLARWLLAVASLATLGIIAYVVTEFSNPQQSGALFSALVQPGIGLWVSGLAGLAGIVIGLVAGSDTSLGVADREVALVRQRESVRRFGEWVVDRSTGVPLAPGARAGLTSADPDWITVATQMWTGNFRPDEAHVSVDGDRLKLTDDRGNSVLLLPANGQNVQLERSMMLHRER